MTNINGEPASQFGEPPLYNLANPGNEWASLQLIDMNTGRLPDGNRAPGFTLLE
jgi:hypothetical protein